MNHVVQWKVLELRSYPLSIPAQKNTVLSYTVGPKNFEGNFFVGLSNFFENLIILWILPIYFRSAKFLSRMQIFETNLQKEEP